MFSNLFSGATLYIILALLASTAGFGYLSYSLSNDKAVAVDQLKTANETVERYKKDVELKDSSCKIDDNSVVESIAEKQEVRDKIDNLVVKINKLKTGVAIAPSDTETNKNAKTTTIYGSELLSLDLRLLLDSAYCIASPQDSICGTTGQPSSIPLQGKPVR